MQHLFAAPVPLRRRGVAVSAEVDAVVLRALSKEPKDRFEQVGDFAHALKQASLATIRPPDLSTETRPLPVPVIEEAGLRPSLALQTKTAPTEPPLAGRAVNITEAPRWAEAYAPTLPGPVTTASRIGHLQRRYRWRRGILVLLAIVLVGAASGGIYLVYRSQQAGCNNSTPVTDSEGSPSEPALAHLHVYVTTQDSLSLNVFVSALRANDGVQEWRDSLVTKGTSALTEANGTVYVISVDGTLWAMNASNGTLRWKVPTDGGAVGSPVAVGDMLYLLSRNGSLSARRVSDGSLRWQRNPAQSLALAAPIVEAGVVYLGFENGAVYALNAADGSPLWQEQTGGAIESSPVVLNHLVYVGSDNHFVSAFQTCDGSIAWKYPFSGSVLLSSTATDKAVYVGSSDGFVSALRANDGRLLWRDQTQGFVSTPPAALDGLVCVLPTSSSFTVLQASDGSFRWKTTLSGVVFPPAIARGVIDVGAAKILHALRASDGSELWQYQTDNTILVPPVVGS